MGDHAVCIHLRERDYFDKDYDITKYDANEIHWCRHFERRIIPARECGKICPAYKVHPDVAQHDSGSVTTCSMPIRSSNVTHEQIRRRLGNVLQRANELLSAVPLDATDEESQGVAELLAHCQRELADVDVEMTELTEQLPKLEHNYYAVLLGGQFTFPTLIDDVRALNQVGGDYDRAKARVAQLSRRREELRRDRRRLELRIKLIAEEIQRRHVLQHIITTVTVRAENTLLACSDPLLVPEHEDLDRFLAEAQRNLVAGTSIHHLQEIAARLEHMRML